MISSMIAVMLGFSSAAFAGEGSARKHEKGAKHEMAEMFMNHLFKKLNLTTEQKAKVEEIRKRHQEMAKTQHASLKSKREELMKLLKSSTATRDQALAKQREIDAITHTLSEGRINSWFESRAHLTPDQLKQLSELKPQWKGKRGR